METRGSPGVLGKGRAGTGPGPAEADDTQPRRKGETQTHRLKSKSLLLSAFILLKSSLYIWNIPKCYNAVHLLFFLLRS